MPHNILVVDDERLIVKGIKFSLEQDGMTADAAYDGEEALSLAKSGRYDLIILDLMMPKIDGLEVCRQIREFSRTPIIMLTAKGDDMDKIMGLEHGADDYLTKPFNIIELKARIKAILRRSKANEPKGEPGVTTRIRSVEVEHESRRVTVGNREISVTVKEFDLLCLLMNNPGKVFSREALLNTIWGYDTPGDVRTVDVHIRRLREKIEENPSDPKYIYTKWGVGYYFK